MKTIDTLKNNFEQIKDITEIEYGILIEILKNFFPEDSEEYKELMTIQENNIDNYDTKKDNNRNNINANNDLLSKFNISEEIQNTILSIYNNFLTQFIPVDNNSKLILDKSPYNFDKKNSDKKQKNYTSFLNNLSENINYTTFKIILNDIVSNNNSIDSFEIFQSREFVDQSQHIDYQIVLKLTNGRTIIFGIDLKNLKNYGNNNLTIDEKFVPIALNNYGEIRNSNEILSDRYHIKSINTRKKNRYVFNIFTDLQRLINKTVINKELDVKLGDFNHIDGFNEIYNFLNNIVKNEIGILNGTITPETQVQRTRDEAIEMVAGYSIEELQQLKKSKKRKKEDKEILEKDIQNITKIEKQKRNHKKPAMRITSLETNLISYLKGEKNLARFIYEIGEDKNSYKIYNFIINNCIIENGFLKRKYKSKEFSTNLNNQQDKLEKFNKILEYAKIKLKEAEILKLVNEQKRILTIEDKEKILSIYKNNFTDIHFSKEDYKNFNDKFSYNSLHLLDPTEISKILSDLRLLIEIDDKITITRDEILSLQNGSKIDRETKRKDIAEILGSKRRTINQKFTLLKYYREKTKLVGTDIATIKEIYKTTFKGYTQTFLGNIEITYENKYLIFQIFKEVTSRINEEIISSKVIAKIEEKLKEKLGDEKIKNLKKSLEKYKKNRLQKNIELFQDFSKKGSLTDDEVNEVNTIIGRYFPGNANNFRNIKTNTKKEKIEFLDLILLINNRNPGKINHLAKKLTVEQYVQKQKELLEINNEEVGDTVKKFSDEVGNIIF